ncbi:hypothetical protein Metal_1396 [Methylomicrobium album BG8]|uniref:Uncharacterized protein n=1 Tax=Methylomicrobium album BG8 TaxID=686340 RepID=H8GK58_METAL|nr:hypothetical protein Metal_1396 [Methylomicrobium album BG8]
MVKQAHSSCLDSGIFPKKSISKKDKRHITKWKIQKNQVVAVFDGSAFVDIALQWFRDFFLKKSMPEKAGRRIQEKESTKRISLLRFSGSSVFADLMAWRPGRRGSGLFKFSRCRIPDLSSIMPDLFLCSRRPARSGVPTRRRSENHVCRAGGYGRGSAAGNCVPS